MRAVLRVEPLEDQGLAPRPETPSGDTALDEIAIAYRTSFRRFLRVAAAILGDAEAARDAVQDAFARAIARRREYRGEGPLDAWLWRIVVNHACTYRRRDNGHGAGDPADWTGVEPVAAPAETGDDVLRELVSLLPERQRLTLFLRHYADLDYEQIARVLGVRPGTVGATLNAAHRTLRGRLEAAGPDTLEEPR